MSLQVVIIGAGAAGLTAALTLLEKGVNVQVFEAKERVGGRILTGKIDDELVEFGGQNICDGGDAQTMRRLIKQFGLKVKRTSIGRRGAFFDGKQLHDEAELMANFRRDLNSLKQQLEKLGSSCTNMREIFDSLMKKESLQYKNMEMRLRAYEGGTLDTLSSSYATTLYHMIAGGVVQGHEAVRNGSDSIAIDTIEGGNSRLLESMARELGDRVQLETPLKKVTKKAGGKLVLAFGGGTTVTADKVILTNPCPTYEKIAFDESIIPSKRLDQIKQVPYSKRGKIILTMPEKKSTSSFLFGIDNAGVCFRVAGSKVVTLYLPIQFTPLTVSDVYEKEKPMLEAIYGTLESSQSMPLYGLDIPFASYWGPIGYSWANDRFAGGSYSYFVAGQEETFGKIIPCGKHQVKALFAPISKTVYFAGEHTGIDPTIAGTMEAAFESGERIARIVLEEC